MEISSVNFIHLLDLTWITPEAPPALGSVPAVPSWGLSWRERLGACSAYCSV